jgi:hypothetical protein
VFDDRLVLPVFADGLEGDGSLEAKGEAVTDVVAEVHLDCCVSTFALEVADVSWSTEFRLDMLASRPVLSPCGKVPDLSMLADLDDSGSPLSIELIPQGIGNVLARRVTRGLT